MSVTSHLIQAAVAACMLPKKVERVIAENRALKAQNAREKALQVMDIE